MKTHIDLPNALGTIDGMYQLYIDNKDNEVKQKEIKADLDNFYETHEVKSDIKPLVDNAIRYTKGLMNQKNTIVSEDEPYYPSEEESSSY